jgi:hypothetical protein
MSTPIIILAGNAGSGKDTVGAYLAKSYNAIAIALADPMKRFARDVFGFSNEALWGPSDLRNADVDFTEEEIARCYARYHDRALSFVKEIVPVALESTGGQKLDIWFYRVMEQVKLAHKISARVVLQLLGTQWGRYVDKNMWTDYALRTARTLLSGDVTYSREYGVVGSEGAAYDYVAITDGRFRNEIVGTTMVNGAAFLIKRGNIKKLSGTAGTHKSETELGGIPRHFFTDVLKNDEDIEYLQSLVDDAMAITFGDTRIVDAIVERSSSPNLQ